MITDEKINGEAKEKYPITYGHTLQIIKELREAHISAATAMRDRMEAENKDLREALEKIFEIGCKNTHYTLTQVANMQLVAQQALNKSK